MKRRLGLISRDDALYNKVRIVTRHDATLDRIDESVSSPEGYDLIFADVRDGYTPDFPCVTIGEGADVPYPFEYDILIDEVRRNKPRHVDRPPLYLEGRVAHLFDREIQLTNKEAVLLGLLLDANGRRVTSAELCERIDSDYNSLKVYVNYLRRKLETDGDKIIFTTRIPGGCYYTIHEKYRRVH